MSTAPKSPHAERWPRTIRRGSGVALFALAPKCLVCAAGYLGLGAMLGLSGPELCGATAPSVIPGWISAALAVGVAATAGLVWRVRRGRRVRTFAPAG